MDMKLNDKIVLVTGASTGIGAAIAEAFGAEGAKVAVHYNKSEKEANAVANRLNAKRAGTGFLVRADLLVPAEIIRMVAEVIEHFGRIDVLVNNAGALVERHSIEQTPDEIYEQIVELNLGSTFRVSKAVIPHLKRAGRGTIINMTSLAARTGGGGGSVIYAATKAAISTLTRGLAKELAPMGIRVNAIAPGIILTPFHSKYTEPAILKALIAEIPLGRGATAGEVAGTALFLASEGLSPFITGETIEVNGGALMA